MNRRELIEWLVTTGGLVTLGGVGASELETIGRAMHHTASLTANESLSRDAAPQFRSLDADTAPVVAAAAERIIPRTDTPGATDAGVTAFIDGMLTDWYPDADRQRFLAGIRALDASAQAQFGRVFASCTEGQQVALLDAAEKYVIAVRQTDTATANASWYAMLKYLTVYGYCTSEPGMRAHLQSWPPPMTFDPAAPVRH